MNYQINVKNGKATPGIGRILIAAAADFDAIATLPPTPSTLEEEVTITADHTFLTDKGFQEVYSGRKKKNFKVTGFGDDDAKGASSMVEIFHPGDNPKFDAWIKRDEDMIVLVGDVDCAENVWKQIGTKCNPARIVADWEFNSGQLAGSDAAGTSLRIEGHASSKLYYTGAVTMTSET